MEKKLSYNNMDINIINPNTRRRVKIGGLIFKKLTHVISPTNGQKIKINGPSYNRIYKHEKISKLNKLLDTKNKTIIDGLDDNAKEYNKEYQSKQVGKEMQNEIIKLIKKHENIINEDKKPEPKKLSKKVENKINKSIQIFKEYEKLINNSNNFQNNDVDNNNEKIPEIEFKVRSLALNIKTKVIMLILIIWLIEMNLILLK